MSYALNSFVNRKEADALKEMIFRRVRERSQAVSEDVQSDVMDLARESFVSKDNPFSQIVQKAEEANNTSIKSESKTEEKREIGFPQRELKSRAVEQTKILSEQITVKTIQDNMTEARAELSNKRSFMGALNFLNSQASIALVNGNSKSFDAIA